MCNGLFSFLHKYINLLILFLSLVFLEYSLRFPVLNMALFLYHLIYVFFSLRLYYLLKLFHFVLNYLLLPEIVCYIFALRFLLFYAFFQFCIFA